MTRNDKRRKMLIVNTCAQGAWDPHHEGGKIKSPKLHCRWVDADGRDNFEKPETGIKKINLIKSQE